MIVAEELDADWSEVQVQSAPVDPAKYPDQYTVGSGSISRCWDSHRNAGATARWLLVQAAAARWGVNAEQCRTESSYVISGNKRLHYTALAQDVSDREIPRSIPLKDPRDFRIIGTRVASVDAEALIRGEPVFGSDLTLPGMKCALYVKCPARGGRVREANVAHIKSLEGALDAFVVEGNGQASELMPGIAIVASSTWAALKARAELKVQWDETEAAADNWNDLMAAATELQSQQGQERLAEEGSVEGALDRAHQRLRAFYSYEFVAHAPMEPMTCTARWADGQLEIWVASQRPAVGRDTVARVLDLAPEQITVHQVRGGGGFGRRLVSDVMCEAALIARRIGGAVKLMWTREDDMNFDFFRPGGFHALEGAIDDAGKVSAWKDHFITLSANGREPVWGGGIEAAPFPRGYVKNFRLERTMLPWSTPCGVWRAPESNVLAFVTQSFLHELSQAGGRDHLEFLLELLEQRSFSHWIKHREGFDPKRAIGVLREVAAKSDWPKPPLPGKAKGLAFFYCHGGYVAQVVELSVSDARKVTVHKVVVAVDVGPIVNLSGAEGQVEGSVLDGLGAMFASVRHDRGRISETNFHRYRLLRNRNIPEIETHFLQTDVKPTGLGEPALPPLAPAVCNGIFSATGHRIRTLPISREGFSI